MTTVWHAFATDDDFALLPLCYQTEGNETTGGTSMTPDPAEVTCPACLRGMTPPAADVQVWGPREGAAGPVHRGLDGRGLYGQSWCGKRSQFRHRVYTAPADTVTCKTCLRRVASGSPLAYGARS